MLNSAAGMDGEEVGLAATRWCISKTLWKVILYGHIKVLLLSTAFLGFFHMRYVEVRRE